MLFGTNCTDLLMFSRIHGNHPQFNYANEVILYLTQLFITQYNSLFFQAIRYSIIHFNSIVTFFT